MQILWVCGRTYIFHDRVCICANAFMAFRKYSSAFKGSEMEGLDLSNEKQQACCTALGQAIAFSSSTIEGVVPKNIWKHKLHEKYEYRIGQ